jgi:DNA-3-methyladenine glycosylase II
LAGHGRGEGTCESQNNRKRTMTPDYWAEACAALAKRDRHMKRLIKIYPEGRLRTRGDAFGTLARSIVGQQISVLAAEAVWQRFATSAGAVRPKQVLALSVDDMRAAGLSRSKAVYLNDLAHHFDAGLVKPRRWASMTDDEIVDDLTRVRGVGRWTVEMFLIFHLMRPNVFPVGDIGMVRAIEAIYHKGERLTKDEVRDYATKWAPWNTVATWYLWRSLDPVIVEY